MSTPLHVYRVNVRAYVTDVSPSSTIGLCVGLSVGRSGKCIVAKRLCGSGCHLGWWLGSVDGWVYYIGWLSWKGKGSFGDDLGHPTVFLW